jgi:hypothetical protein
MDHTAYAHTEAEGYVVAVVDWRIHTDEPGEPGALAGRPADDRALEVVESGLGAATGLAVGTTIAGPIGAAVGIVVGAAAGFIAGEMLERRMGRVATTSNAEPDGMEASTH